MRHLLTFVFVFSVLTTLAPLATAEPIVTYWDTPEGKVIRARMATDADYWQLIPT